MIKLKLFPAANQWIPENAFYYVFWGWQELLTKIICIPELPHTTTTMQGNTVATGCIQAGARQAQQAPKWFVRYIAISHFPASHTTFIIQLLASVPHSGTKVNSPAVTDSVNFQAVSLPPALSHLQEQWGCCARAGSLQSPSETLPSDRDPPRRESFPNL